jgi:hypothetical protein
MPRISKLPKRVGNFARATIRGLPGRGLPVFFRFAIGISHYSRSSVFASLSRRTDPRFTSRDELTDNALASRCIERNPQEPWTY